MLLTITEVKRNTGLSQEFRWSESPQSLALSEGNLRDDAWLEAPFEVRLSIRNGGDRLILEGHFEAQLRMVCGRCLKEFQTLGFIPIEEQMLLTQQVAQDAAEDEDDPDRELEVLEGDTIDVTALVRENLLSQLPMKPLCTEECLGLCPTCGVDLNLGECDCATTDVDPRLAGLAAWLEPKP